MLPPASRITSKPRSPIAYPARSTPTIDALLPVAVAGRAAAVAKPSIAVSRNRLPAEYAGHPSTSVNG